MARNEPQVNLRMPQELKTQLEETAKANGRSLTAEIVARLSESFIDPPGARVNERRKLELVNSYAKWCRDTGADPFESFSSYARAYADPDKIDAIDHVSWIDEVDPHYLSELYSMWVIERPQRFPILADRLVATSPRELQKTFKDPEPEFIAEIERRAAEWGCSKTQALIRMTIEEVSAKK